MDGNGRWAKARGLPRIEGHRRGVGTVRRIIEECAKLQLEQLTLYCFSSENWKRPRTEQLLLMQLLEQYVVEERGDMMRQKLRFSAIGDMQPLGEHLNAEIDLTKEMTSKNPGMRLCLAVNYGSRNEIVEGVKS